MWKLLILDEYHEVANHLKNTDENIEITYIGQYPNKDKVFKEFILLHDGNIDLLIEDRDTILNELVENILVNKSFIFPESEDNKLITLNRSNLGILLDETFSSMKDYNNFQDDENDYDYDYDHIGNYDYGSDDNDNDDDL